MTTHISPYKDVHKGIRKLLLDLLQVAGNTDFTRQEQLAELQRFFTQVQDLLELHTEIENQLLAPLISAAGGASELEDIESRHAQLHGASDELDKTLNGIAAGGDNRSGQVFYLKLSRFVADQLQHMADEENRIWPLVSAHCSDVEMIQLQAQARQIMPPVVLQTLFKAMIPAINFSERLIMLTGMRKALAPEAFGGICQLARTLLSEAQWQELSGELGLETAA